MTLPATSSMMEFIPTAMTLRAASLRWMAAARQHISTTLWGGARRTVSGTGYEEVYDPQGNMVAEVRTSDAMWMRGEVYGRGHLATYWGGGTYFAHSDWLGSERVRSDWNGNSAGTCTSNPYGDSTTCAGTDPSPIKYAGMEYDSETQLYHTLFRYYNPRLGLWMTPDPAGLAAANPRVPQSLNRYAYVGNAPANFFDPLGLIWVLFEQQFCVDSGAGDHCETASNWV